MQKLTFTLLNLYVKLLAAFFYTQFISEQEHERPYP